jgi:hypothetical protein
MSWPNPGYCPDRAKGKRVIVKLANGLICGRNPVSATTPPGWAADGPQGCRWSIAGHPFDIANYEVLG